MDDLKKTIHDINQKYKPLIIPEKVNDQPFSVDPKFLHNTPKSPRKLPKLKTNLGSGNWQVRKIKCIQLIPFYTYF